MPTWRAFAGVPYELGDGHGDALYPSTMFRVGHVERRACAGGGGRVQGHRRADGARAAGRATLSARGRDPAPAARSARVARQRHADRQCAGPRDERHRCRATERRRARGPAPDRRVLALPERRGAGLRTRRASSTIAPQVGMRETRRIARRLRVDAAKTCSAARASTTASASTPGRWRAMRAGRIEWQFPRDERNTYNQLPWRMLVPQRRRQSAGGRPLRVDGARGPVGGARQRRRVS